MIRFPKPQAKGERLHYETVQNIPGIVAEVLFSSKCNHKRCTQHKNEVLGIKTNGLHTDIVYKNRNSNFIGHSLGIPPVGLYSDGWELLLVQSMHMEMGAGIGRKTWTIQYSGCVRDEMP